MKTKNQLLQLIRHTSRCGSKMNQCHYHKQNTDAHEDTKWMVFKELRRQGYDVLTEAIFANGKGRADIVAFYPGGHAVIVEILQSETDEMFEAKAKKYPRDFILAKFRVGQSIEEFQW